MTRDRTYDGFRLPNDRRDLTYAELRWVELLRDLYAGPVRAPRLVDAQTLRAALQLDTKALR